jgi:hypothetical protein
MSKEKPLPELTEAQTNAKKVLAVLPLIDNPLTLSPDELVCLKLLRDACEDILKGGDISPAAPGTHKLRLIRRVQIGFFTAEAPRPVTP